MAKEYLHYVDKNLSLMNNSISSEISFNNENKIETVLGKLKELSSMDLQ